MTVIRREIEEAVTRLIGETAAQRLGLHTPENVSSGNKVVNGYVDSIDGAIRRGEPPSHLGEDKPSNNSANQKTAEKI